MKITDWDTHLVLRAQAGERVAFEILADQYRDTLRHHAYRMLRDTDDASDAVQETLVKGLRAIKRFHPGRPVLPWLLRICSNCCVDQIRTRKQRPECLEKFEGVLADGSKGAAEELEERLESEVIRTAIERLPSRYRDIIWMRHFRDMDVAEIAAALKKPEGTIKSWLFRARALLKKDLITPLMN